MGALKYILKHDLDSSYEKGDIVYQDGSNNLYVSLTDSNTSHLSSIDWKEYQFSVGEVTVNDLFLSEHKPLTAELFTKFLSYYKFEDFSIAVQSRYFESTNLNSVSVHDILNYYGEFDLTVHSILFILPPLKGEKSFNYIEIKIKYRLKDSDEVYVDSLFIDKSLSGVFISRAGKFMGTFTNILKVNTKSTDIKSYTLIDIEYLK